MLKTPKLQIARTIAVACATPIILFGQTEKNAPAEEEILIELPQIAETPTPAVEQNQAPEAVATEPIPVNWVGEETPSVAPVVIDATQPDASPTVTPEIVNIPELAPQLSPEEEVIMQLPQGGAPAPVFGDEETISVNYLDEEVATVLRNVALLYDLNLVVPDSLAGRISLKLSNVTWRQVFEVVLESTGFTYIEEANIIKIRSIEDLAVEPVDTRVFIINFANATEISSSVSPLINTGAGGRIQVDNRSNALIITERPSRMNKIQEIIERLDRETLQVKIESKFIEVTDRDASNIGLNWTSLNGFQVGTSPLTRTLTSGVEEVVSFTNNGPSENWVFPGQEYADSVAAGRGGAPYYLPEDQYFYSEFERVDVSAVDGDGNFLRDDAGEIITEPDIEYTLGAYTPPVSSLTNTRSFARTDSVVMTADGFNVVLSALETLTDVKLVSNPTIVTLNNESALISIGERFPIPSYTYNDERGTYEISNFEYEDIGINLEVTPQVNSAGFINLDILPEVSSRQGTVAFGGASGAEIPIIASRRTETKVTIKDGYTLALGGLMETETSKDGTKVPILGDLPLLGKLFRSESNSMQSRNLIIFITAKTLSPDGSDYRDVIDPRMLNAMGIRESEIPGYSLTDDERQALNSIQRSRDDIDLQKTIAARRAELEKLEAAQTYIQEQKDGTAEEIDEEWWRKD